MAVSDHVDLPHFMEGVKRRNPGEVEFHQAVYEVAGNVFDFIADKEVYHEYQILRRITEPDRVVSFRVCWEDDKGDIRVHRGWRVQNNNAIGPYKGGLRFHQSVNQSILKFLAFEQTFKNSLTGLPMGGGKGGSNFNPRGKSDHEVMRFCQSFMSELYRHVGEDVDVPAGDIGVGGREIGYLFGQYKRLTNRFVGVLTGKGMEYGGSPIRTEATGYGTVYFMESMLNRVQDSVDGKTCLVSGCGNVAQHAVEKIDHLGGKAVTLSDSGGFIYDPEGIDADKLKFVKDLKNVRRGRLSEYAKEFGIEHHEGRPWANMPTEQQGIHAFTSARVLFAPSKAANAGGVAVSGLEMSQNSARITWKERDLQQLLRDIMTDIHDRCVEHGRSANDDYVNYVKGANIAAFIKVADAMLAYGVV